jgi:hypothetical protein
MWSESVINVLILLPSEGDVVPVPKHHAVKAYRAKLHKYLTLALDGPE